MKELTSRLKAQVAFYTALGLAIFECQQPAQGELIKKSLMSVSEGTRDNLLKLAYKARIVIADDHLRKAQEAAVKDGDKRTAEGKTARNDGLLRRKSFEATPEAKALRAERAELGFRGVMISARSGLARLKHVGGNTDSAPEKPGVGGGNGDGRS